MKLLVILLFTACIITGSLGALVVPGPCRSLNVTTDFDVEAYLGVWYELQRYDFDRQTELDCSTASYTLLDNGSVEVHNSATDLSTNDHRSDTGVAVLSFPDEVPLRGLLNVTFSEDQPATNVNYRVLSTDYVNYTVVWSCANTADGNSLEFAWVLVRSYPANASVRADIDAVINDNLDASALRTTVQEKYLCLGGGITPYQ